MRRLLGIAGALCGVLLAATPTAQASAGLHLAALQAQFPGRAFSLVLPRPLSLATGQVHITENGGPVVGASIVPASALPRLRFGVVLVIDASESMAGAPIRDAIAAADRFAAHNAVNEQLAVVAFNRTVTTISPFSASVPVAQSALATPPPLASGTHLYDATSRAVEMIRAAGYPSGAVVILSDGADTGSSTAVQTAVRQAQQAHVRIYAVGIRSRSFRAAPLRTLAAGTHATFTVAGTSQALPAIYDRLGRELANQYVIRYRSTAAPKDSVTVQVRVDGISGSASTTYTAPPLPPPPAPYHKPISLTFWRSSLPLIVTAAGSALLLGLAVLLLIRPRTAPLRNRMGAFVSIPSTAKEERGSPLVGRVLSGADRSLDRAGWWARFKQSLDIAEIQIPAVRLAAIALLGAAFVGMLFAVAVSPWAFPVGVIVPFALRSFVQRRVERRRRAFADQLPDNLQMLASALRAGHSFVGALSVVVDDCAEPARSEFRRVIADEQLGVSLDDALNVVVERMANRDLEQIAIVAALQRQTGGNTAEVLDRVTETVRERSKLRGLVRTLTAQGRASRWIVSALPVVLLGLIMVINPHYLDPMFSHALGRAMLVAAAVMIVAGSLVIRRIVNIKV
jgi:tight adherence protein B